MYDIYIKKQYKVYICYTQTTTDFLLAITSTLKNSILFFNVNILSTNGAVISTLNYIILFTVILLTSVFRILIYLYLFLLLFYFLCLYVNETVKSLNLFPVVPSNQLPPNYYPCLEYRETGH